MTESQWLTSVDPLRLLAHLRQKQATERKVRLFVCACWRPRLGVIPRPERSLAEIEAVEQDRHHGMKPHHFPTFRDFWDAAIRSSEVGIRCTSKTPPEPGLSAVQQTAVLRDLFGNPFRSVSLSPEWRTGTAVSLARQMYDLRDFSAMPILGDALQDAGCDSDDVLTHCRDVNQTHVRGCWVVDSVLGKE